MISILIPTYNYNVYPLVKEIHKQFDKTGIDFEILVYDDGSTKTFDSNLLLKELKKVHYKVLSENIGRIGIRMKLANDAKYPYLLFMDADVFPKDRFFAVKLLQQINDNRADVYFGGINVAEQPPSPDKTLRWKFGKNRENLPVKERQKFPYRSILCGTVCIKKDIFLTDIQIMKNINRYGLDTLFSYQLKKNKRSIVHFHNPVIHLGLETNEAFVEKTEKAVETIHYLVQQKLLPEQHIKLTRTAEKFINYIPVQLCLLLYKSLKKILRNNLTSKQASLFVFDIYKLLYYCQLK